MAFFIALIEFKKVFFHSLGIMTPFAKDCVPEDQRWKMIWNSRLYMAIKIGIIYWAFHIGSFLPCMFIVLPNMYGSCLLQFVAMTQHGGLKVFGATFFAFSDYEHPALRLRALQKLPVITEYTHDSIYVGEDGPTHQPIEHLMACRTIPGLMVFRPADVNEASISAEMAFNYKDKPSIILLTRQKLPVIDREKYSHYDNFRRGGYVISESDGAPDITIIATGSEVNIALDAGQSLMRDGIPSRIVSLPAPRYINNRNSFSGS